MSKPQILFEDSQLLIINKPAGLIVNNSDTTRNVPTVQNMVAEYLRLPRNKTVSIKKEGEWEDPETAFIMRDGIVHRLDKETSGILLIAKTLESFISLQRQFKERVVKKRYIALAHGKLLPSEGEIQAPVGRLSFNRKRFGVVAGGRESVTQYKVLHYVENLQTREVLSLVELFPKTGRTHQIRVHLQHVGHPIFADELYAGRKVSRNDRKILPRVFLHASAISFAHPVSSKEISFIAPLPNELTNVLESFTLQK